jgi:hypothetical protein
MRLSWVDGFRAARAVALVAGSVCSGFAGRCQLPSGGCGAQAARTDRLWLLLHRSCAALPFLPPQRRLPHQHRRRCSDQASPAPCSFIALQAPLMRTFKPPS